MFDSYSIAARLMPALMTLIPVIVTTAVWTPALYALAYGILLPSVECALAFLLMQIARSLGRSAERRLFDKWGGKPTSRWLLRSDGTLDELTKARYRRYLQEHIAGWEAPSQAAEETDRKGAMSKYDSAIRRLRAATRDREQFNLVFAENVSYGFLRNCCGLRWIGRPVALLCVMVNCVGLYLFASSAADPISISGRWIASFFGGHDDCLADLREPAQGSRCSIQLCTCAARSLRLGSTSPLSWRVWCRAEGTRPHGAGWIGGIAEMPSGVLPVRYCGRIRAGRVVRTLQGAPTPVR